MMTLVRSQRRCKGAKEEVVEEKEGTAPRMIRGQHSLPESCQSWRQRHMIPGTKMVRSWECNGTNKDGYSRNRQVITVRAGSMVRTKLVASFKQHIFCTVRKLNMCFKKKSKMYVRHIICW
jgi:hypothetical protein